MHNSKCNTCCEHLKRKIKRHKKTIDCLLCNQRKMEKDIIRLQRQMDQMLDVIQISCNSVTIGNPNNPIQNIYTENIGDNSQSPNNLHIDNIINTDYSMKGICLDDATAALTPSFNTFPESWIIAGAPISMCRTYHYNLNTPEWIEWFVENNISVMVGITLDDYQNELDAFSVAYLAADSGLKGLYDQYIIAIGVGNENVDKRIADRNSGMLYAKTLISNSDLPMNAKVTTVLSVLPRWITPTYPPDEAKFTDDFKQLLQNLEIVCFNMYDAYSTISQPLNVRLSWMSQPPNILSIMLNVFGAMRFAMASAGISYLPFWCVETGWESVPGLQGASVPNLETYYNNFLNFNMEEEFYPQEAQHSVLPPDKIFYFTIRDVRGETFGLYTSNSTLTPKF